MKKIRRIAALILAMAMVFAMGVSSFAATGAEPSAEDTAQVYVYDVEAGVTLTAYHLISATYDSKGNGLTGYEIASAISKYDLTMESPTANEITYIAQEIYNGKVTKLESVQLTYDSDTESYTASLTAGMWLILVYDSGAVVYNPMVVSNWYSDANLASSLQPGYVSADSSFVEASWTDEDDPSDRTYTASATAIYAKSDETDIDKEITNYTDCEDGTTDSSEGADYNVGDTVSFKLTTHIPDYSDAYDNSKTTFIITDTLSKGFDTVSASDITVAIGGDVVTAASTRYSLTVTENSDGTQTITIDFASSYIMDNGNKDIVVTYSAVLNEDAVVVGGTDADANTNTATIEYSNHPDTTIDSEEIGGGDSVYIYTFSITDEISKVIPGGTASASGNDVAVTGALEGAEFTIYTDEDCTDIYTNANNGTGVSTSDEDGFICFYGLQEGTYYITETESPSDYMINDTVYKIVIAATYDTAEDSVTEGMITSYTITVTDLESGTSYVNEYEVEYTTTAYSYTVSSENSDSSNDYTWYEVTGTSVAASQNPVAIVDPDLIKLPSTGGMGIYVVLGISIAILAAGAFFVLRSKGSRGNA